jgi:16S rRNA (guanine527-N7)-methyltransferase
MMALILADKSAWARSIGPYGFFWAYVMSQEDLQARFIQTLHQLAPAITEQQVEQFFLYRQLLLEWNERFNLTAITNPGEILVKHFLDSLSLLSAFHRDEAHVLDLGAGAGFPGLPLKIVRPAWRVVLMEATGKKVTFLRHIIETLGLRGVEAVHGRAEELAHQPFYRGAFDLVTARAVAALPTLLEYAAPFCRVGGRMVFPKKGDLAAELARGNIAARRLGAALVNDVTVTLPGLGDGRRLLVYEQVKRCPQQYPRSGSSMAKKPLA